MKKATSLGNAIPNLDHTRALTVAELDTFYVDREEVRTLLEEMTVLLEHQYPSKMLLTGHRGAGKSSALTRLGQMLNDRQKLWVVHFSVLDKLDLNDLNYVDIVFLIAVEILEQCKERNIDISSYDRRLQSWAKEIEIVRQESESMGIGVEASAKVSSPKLGWLTSPIEALLSLGTKVGKEVSTRKTIREELEPQFSELLGIIDDLQQAILKTTEKQLICLIDGPDKTSIQTAETLFYKTGYYLAAPNCSIIYTFPIALHHSNDVNQIRAYFTRAFSLPNFKVQKRHNASDQAETTRQEKGISLLREVITRRASYELFEDEALQTIVLQSGGIVRTAIMLAQQAAVKALARKAEKISNEHVKATVAEERRAFNRMLSEKQRDLLRKVQKTESIDVDHEAGYLELLHNLSLIEYINDDDWYGVNPIVKDLL